MIKSKFPFIKTTVLGLVSVGGIEVISRYIIPEWIRNYSSCYKEAMQNLRNNAEAVNVLGEPIKEGRINYSDKLENDADANLTWYTVPVEGSKTSGKLRYWITYDKRSSLTYRLIRMYPSNMTLINTVLFGALGLSGIGLTTEYLIRRNIRNSWCYQEAVKSLHDHPEAQQQLGQPIVEGNIDLGDTVGNNRDEKRIWYSVPVKGPKSSGKMIYYIREDNSSDRKFKVSKIELALDHIKDKALLIKNEDSV